MSAARSRIQTGITAALAPFTLLGNFTVCVIVFKERRMRTYTYCLLANLALADLLYGVMEIVEILVFHVATGFTPGYVCRVTGYLTFITLSVSLATLTVIARERYTAVTKPLFSRRSHKKHSVKIILVTWVASIVFTLPIIFLSRTSKGFGRRACEVSPVSLRYGIYHVCIGVLGVLIPCFIISRCYYRIIKSLWMPRNIRASSTNSLTESRRKLTKLLIFVTLVFLSCWVTFSSEQVLFIFDAYSDELEVFCYFMLQFNAFCNPIAYSLHSPRFRARVRGLFCRCRIKGRLRESLAMNQLKHCRPGCRPRYGYALPRVNPGFAADTPQPILGRFRPMNNAYF